MSNLVDEPLETLWHVSIVVCPYSINMKTFVSCIISFGQAVEKTLEMDTSDGSCIITKKYLKSRPMAIKI
jgi:hypothetical protein